MSAPPPSRRWRTRSRPVARSSGTVRSAPFETPPFDRATVALAQTAAALTQSGSLVSVAGGGDTVAALNHAGVAADFTFVSTAGGAFLEWMEGKELPGVAALMTSNT
jgi:3-phosphoglycerate kinase